MNELEDHQKGGNPVGNAKRGDSIGRHYRSRSLQYDRGDFPPTMPLLAWTGSSAGQMPWVLKRSYTDNGRLVIREVKASHSQCFRAHRVNGRLTLHLMHANDPINSPRYASDDQIDAVESDDENEEKDRYIRKKASSFNPFSPQSLAFWKGEKYKHLALHPLGPENQETPKMEERENTKESITRVKRMEKGFLKLPTSASSSSLSSLASSSEKKNVRRNLFNQGNCKKTPEVSRTASLPSISSSMAELLFGKGGNGIGFFPNNRSNSNSPFQLPMPTIGSVHS